MEKRKLNRRDFLRLSAAAATGAVVAACAPAAPQVVEVEKEVLVKEVVVQTVVVEKEVIKEAKPAELVKLRHQTREPEMAEEEKLLWDALYPVFREKHPNIEVQYIPMPPDFSDKLIAAAVAGDAPDTYGHC